MRNLLGYKNHKTIKGEKLNVMTAIMYLAPAELALQAGVKSTACPFATKECKSLCLFSAGYGVYNRVRNARIDKTRYLLEGKKWNEVPDIDKLDTLKSNILSFIKKAYKNKMSPAIRLNGTSDFPVHKWGLMQEFSYVVFYDYTKDYKKMLEFLDNKLPSNYHLTYSYDGYNWDKCKTVLSKGGNVAIVFDKIPEKYQGFTVINGDDHDVRFLDKKNVIVGLTPKGKARKNKDSKFIVRS